MGRMAIILVFVLSITFGYFFISLSRHQTQAGASVTYNQRKLTVRNIAAYYASQAKNQLESDWTWTTGISANNPFGVTGATARVTVQNHNTNASVPAEQMWLTSVATLPAWDEYNPALACTTSVVLRRGNFAQYGLFSASNPSAYFWDGESVYGPLHINGRLMVGGTPGVGPQFYGRVTATSGISYTNGLNANNWHGLHAVGNDLNTTSIPMPNNLGLSSIDTSTAYRPPTGYNYVDMKSNGTLVLSKNPFYSYKYSQGQECITLNVSDIYNNYGGIIYSTTGMNVRGTLKGQLTIATTSTITAWDDIYYSDPPDTNPNSTDLLGLMSGGDFIIKTTDGSNLDGCYVAGHIYTEGASKIQDYANAGNRGYFYSMGGRVQQSLYQTFTTTVSNYYKYTLKNYTDIYGNTYQCIESKTLTKRGSQTSFTEYTFQEMPIRTGNNTTVYKNVVTGSRQIPCTWAGMKEEYHYDTRLERMKPPGYPYTGKTKFLSWSESI